MHRDRRERGCALSLRESGEVQDRGRGIHTSTTGLGRRRDRSRLEDDARLGAGNAAEREGERQSVTFSAICSLRVAVRVLDSYSLRYHPCLARQHRQELSFSLSRVNPNPNPNSAAMLYRKRAYGGHAVHPAPHVGCWLSSPGIPIPAWLLPCLLDVERSLSLSFLDAPISVLGEGFSPWCERDRWCTWFTFVYFHLCLHQRLENALR